MAPMFEEEMFVLLSGLLSSVPSMLLSIASYVLSAVAIYSISRRRGLRKPWLAWIPVLNVWLLGSLSDQYQYVVKGENKAKRKLLLFLSVLMFVLTLALVALFITAVVSVIMNGGYYNEQNLMANVFGQLMAILGILLPLSGTSIAYAVIRYMALYDLYKSLDPDNSVLFLVLSILFGITEPFFLFFNRSKDKGMPPRRQEPVYAQAEPVRESWESENKDYL